MVKSDCDANTKLIKLINSAFLHTNIFYTLKDRHVNDLGELLILCLHTQQDMSWDVLH